MRASSGSQGNKGRVERIPAIDLPATYAALKTDLDAAVERVLASGRYIGGPEVEGLEREFAQFCGVPHAVAVASGTDALRFALMTAGVGAGSEVITSPLSFIATTEAVTQAGARPVFVDVEPESLTLDPERLATALTEKTKAIVPVHLYGQTADMAPILTLAGERGLAVIEDACQSHGAQYRESAGAPGRAAGALGDAGCFSFYPTKNLGGCGEGGMVTTARAEMAERVRRLRDHGQSEKYIHAEEGYNGRLDALQAAILRVKLKRLGGWNERRRALAARYTARLRETGLADMVDGTQDGRREGTRALFRLPVEKPWGRHVYHLYTVRVAAGGAAAGGVAGQSPRDRVRAALLERGIEAGIHYPIPLHMQPAYAWMGLKEGSFPQSERAAREVLSLPLYPEMTEAQVDRVCEALREVLRKIFQESS